MQRAEHKSQPAGREQECWKVQSRRHIRFLPKEI
jgi:hypothetical protein